VLCRSLAVVQAGDGHLVRSVWEGVASAGRWHASEALHLRVRAAAMATSAMTPRRLRFLRPRLLLRRPPAPQRGRSGKRSPHRRRSKRTSPRQRRKRRPSRRNFHRKRTRREKRSPRLRRGRRFRKSQRERRRRRKSGRRGAQVAPPAQAAPAAPAAQASQVVIHLPARSTAVPEAGAERGGAVKIARVLAKALAAVSLTRPLSAHLPTLGRCMGCSIQLLAFQVGFPEERFIIWARREEAAIQMALIPASGAESAKSAPPFRGTDLEMLEILT